jgi:hypothetical protein
MKKQESKLKIQNKAKASKTGIRQGCGKSFDSDCGISKKNG